VPASLPAVELEDTDGLGKFGGLTCIDSDAAVTSSTGDAFCWVFEGELLIDPIAENSYVLAKGT
jgi:hypothetical protein